MPFKAIYPGTFDPITRGHEDVVRRAAKLFDDITVAVAESEKKRPIFPLAERVEMGKAIFADLPNVTVTGFSNLLADFAHEIGAKVILRGLRAASDFEYEFQMAGMMRQMAPDIQTIFMTPSDNYMFVSSTIVREIARFNGDVSRFVQPIVAERLARWHKDNFGDDAKR